MCGIYQPDDYKVNDAISRGRLIGISFLAPRDDLPVGRAMIQLEEFGTRRRI